MEKTIQKVQELWNAHESTPFPTGYRSKKIDGVSITVIESEVAGYILTYTATGGSLGSRQVISLKNNLTTLNRIIDEAETEEAKNYFNALYVIAKEVSETCHDTPK